MMVGAKKLKKKKIFVEHSYIAQIFQNNKKKINEINKDEKFISLGIWEGVWGWFKLLQFLQNRKKISFN